MTRGAPILALGLAMLASSGCDDPARERRVEAGRVVRAVSAVRDALGGVEQVLSVRSIQASARCAGPNAAVTRVIEARTPDLVRLEETTENGSTLTTVCRSDGGWRLDSGGWVGVPPERCAEIRLLAVPLFVLRYDLLLRDLSVENDVEFAGQACLRLSGRDRSGRPVSVYIGDSALPVGFRLEPLDPGGPATTIDLSDWREAGPVRLPHYATITRNGELWRCTFSDLEVNSVAESRFHLAGVDAP